MRVGSGRGSRRLYAWEDIFRIGIADRLVKFGIAPDAVGAAISEIPNSILAPYEAMLWANNPESEGKLKSKDTRLLVKVGDVMASQKSERDSVSD